jgi:hypothetical protein
MNNSSFSNIAPSTYANNAATLAFNKQPTYQDEEMVTFSSDQTFKIDKSENLNVVSNFDRKSIAQEYGTIDIKSDSNIQELQFKFETEGWTKPSELMINLTFNITVTQVNPLNFQDQPLMSTKMQSPFCFLNSLEYYDGFIGKNNFNQTPDYFFNNNIKATKAIMCHNERNEQEHKITFSAGLPCQKGNPIYLFENANYTYAIDEELQPYFNSVSYQPGNQTQSTYKNVTFFLRDLFPWLDTEDKLFPPGIVYNFRFRFDLSKQVNDKLKKYTSLANENLVLNSEYSFVTIAGSGQRPLSNESGQCQYILYDQYMPRTEISNELKLFTNYVYNTWTYEFYAQSLGNVPQEKISIYVPMISMPSRVIIYFTSPNDEPFIASNNVVINNFMANDGHGYLQGYKIQSCKLTQNGTSIYEFEDNSPTIATSTFTPNNCAWDYMMNNDDFKNFKTNKTRVCTQKLATYNDCFIPHSFNLAPQLPNKPSIRPLIGEKINFGIELTFSHIFQYFRNFIRPLTNPVNCVNILPPDSTINIIFQYATQYTFDENKNLNFVRAPRFLLTQQK